VCYNREERLDGVVDVGVVELPERSQPVEGERAGREKQFR